MSTKFYRPRLLVDLTEEQALKLQKLIPWGLKNALFSVIIDDLIELIESKGEKCLAALLSKSILARESLKSLVEVAGNEPDR